MAVTTGMKPHGCSEGHNSGIAMRKISAALRNRTDRPLQAIFSDLPTNDDNPLFTNRRVTRFGMRGV
jgi:hypothetical protein